tara:strand:+ start:1284 stop:2582 length:1299 start_codon:yes stop_codon:yes gene_type:complete
MKSLLKYQNKIFFKRFDNLIFKLFSNQEIGWKIDFKIALIAFAITIFFAFPSLWLYFRPDKAGRLMYQMLQSENPLNRDLPLTAQILSYRFLVPTLNYFLGLRGYGVVLIPVISSFINLYLISRIIRKSTKDVLFTVICVVGISLTWFIAEGTAFWNTTDSVSHLLLLLPAAFKLNPTYFIFALPSALFVDERSIFACAFLWLFLMRRDLMCVDYLNKIGSNFLNLKITKNLILTTCAMFIGFILWILGRYIIDAGIIAPAPDISIVTNQIPFFWQFFGEYWPIQILNYLSSFKWVFFYPLFLIINLLKKSTNSFRAIYGFNFKGYFGIHILLFLFYSSIVMINGDVWRSMSFTYFFILESILILHNLNKELISVLNYWITLLMLATPVSFFGMNLTPQISFPLPVVLLRTYSGFGDSYLMFLKKLFIFVPS